MNRNIIFLIGMNLFMMYGCGGSSGSTTTPYVDISYDMDSSVNRLNPDRGMYDSDYVLNERVDYDRFQMAYDKGFRLVYASLNLESYKDVQTLPEDLLATIENSLQEAQQSGVKIILRIIYRNSLDGTDPQKSIILGHLEQLRPLFQDHADAISVVQAGLIGAWGEWHTFTGEFNEGDPNYLSNRREVLEKLAEIIPNKFIQIRTPMHKEALFGSYRDYGDTTTDAQITPEIAYSNDIRARVGHHNDYFLSSDTDMGTYESSDILFWKEYVKNDSAYAPSGGESGQVIDDNDASLSDCPNALKELQFLEYSFINGTVNETVIEKWKAQGCYDTIAENIGYKLTLEKFGYYFEENKLHLRLTIQNRGYAAPFINYEGRFIMHGEDMNISAPLTWDLRTLKPGVTLEFEKEMDLSMLDPGSYCLELQIGESSHSVHLANKMVWNDTYESNQLLCGLSYGEIEDINETN